MIQLSSVRFSDNDEDSSRSYCSFFCFANPSAMNVVSRPWKKPKVADSVETNNFRSQRPGSIGDRASPSGSEYEVFLSFRGLDTRKGFTDFLYHAFLDAGIRAFRDDEDLRIGGEIGGNLLRAIEQSKISVPIFSENYASSKWCLKELAFMLERKKKGKHTILPVFYDVTPNEVQDQTGNYGEALRKHEEKYGEKIVEQWREALTEVGHLKGMDLVKLANGYQGQFMKLIVSKVLRELKKDQVIVTYNLVGIDGHVKAVKHLLQLGVDDTRIIGIWGLGGIGKTTLAKVIYNQILDGFQSCSFLQNIRETLQCNGLEYLQSSLVADLSMCNKPYFRSIDEGISDLEERYRDRKVLIVLDDIDDTDQLNALVIGCDSFGLGSRIIITTRNKYVLDGDKVDNIYEVKAMTQDHALKLFCKHAFRKDTPTNELSGLSNDIVKTTGGLPLALEVIGSFLSGKNRMVWEGTLEKLKMVPNEKVQYKLRISFEALDHEQKQIFLDIACFFTGEDIKGAFPMWEDCKFFPKVGINVLVAQSLIKIGDGDKIWMHDQVRDLGREIVRQENYDELGKCSRLWRSKEVKYVLTNQMGPSKLKAIRVNCHKCCFMSEQFRNLLNLRFLNMNGDVRIIGDVSNLLPSLRWLRLTNSSLKFLINLHLPNLVSLDLRWSKVTDHWNSWGSFRMMKLKVLNLAFSQGLKRTPNFSLFPNLERLILSYCKQLEVIDPSICKLKNLTYLDISFCTSIQELPPQLSYLVKLETLDVSMCLILTRIPSSIGRLTSLSDLALDGTEITVLPDSIWLLVGLRRISLSWCIFLTELPQTIGRLSLLEILILKNTNIRSLPVNLGMLFNLQTLDLECSDRLEIVPKLPGSLNTQQVDKQASLIILNISGCKKIKTLPSLSNLKLLKVLDAGGCTDLEELVGLNQLNALESLDVNGCGKLRELEGLGELKALESLTISKCKEIEKLPDLSMLKQLKELDANDCEKLRQLVGIGELKALKTLTISGCKEVEKLPDLSKLKQLEALNACGCEKLCELAGVSNLENLKILFVGGCKEIETLPDLSKLVKLESLSIWGCEKLPEEWLIENVDCLQHLRLNLEPHEIPARELKPDPRCPLKPDERDVYDLWGKMAPFTK